MSGTEIRYSEAFKQKVVGEVASGRLRSPYEGPVSGVGTFCVGFKYRRVQLIRQNRSVETKLRRVMIIGFELATGCSGLLELCCQSGLPGGQSTKEETPMKRAFAIVCVGAVVLGATLVMAQEHEYVGHEKCKMCHKVQHGSWLETTHAKATEAARESTDREYTSECLTCHATNSTEELAGVQCEACHGPGADYKKMSVMKDREKAVANGLIIPSQETCNACHTGDDHSKSVVYEDMVDNKEAIHEFKNR